MTKHKLYEAVAEATIRRLADSSDTQWSFGAYVRKDGGTHALDEMKKDGIDFSDVIYVLARGTLIKSEQILKYGEVRYRVVGENVDGIRMTFIVTVREPINNIEIVTAWVNR